MTRQSQLNLLCILTLYIVWGTSYFAIHACLLSFPAFTIAGLRFTIAGLVLMATLRLRGPVNLTFENWVSAALSGFLLLGIGSGAVVYAQQWVPSGMAAIMVAGVGFWIALFSFLFGKRLSGAEWLGIVMGVAGVTVVHGSHNLKAHPQAALALLCGPAAFALATVLGPRMKVAKGLAGSASQMLAGGLILLLMAAIHGEHLPAHVKAESVWALLYLTFFASILAFSAYGHLVQAVRPALATSYAYVNPVVAVLIGRLLADEPLEKSLVGGLALTLVGVFFIGLGQRANLTSDVLDS